jgi:hypothetical protein
MYLEECPKTDRATMCLDDFGTVCERLETPLIVMSASCEFLLPSVEIAGP